VAVLAAGAVELARVRSPPLIPALPRLDIAWRRALEATRAEELSVRTPTPVAAAETAGAAVGAVAGLLPAALLVAESAALPVVDKARRRAREASRALEVEVFAVCAIVYPVAWMLSFRSGVQPRPSKTTNAIP
jgi:hypothetical protein